MELYVRSLIHFGGVLLNGPPLWSSSQEFLATGSEVPCSIYIISKLINRLDVSLSSPEGDRSNFQKLYFLDIYNSACVNSMICAKELPSFMWNI
jgi:hypothetical protein